MNFPVAVSTYSPGYEQIAERSVDVICDMIEGQMVDLPSIAISGQLVERGSVRRIGSSVPS
jgi:DNA-binding LacI/PurR family transcriptional regulator